MSQPTTLPLLAPIGARYESLTVDSKLVNGFVEKGVGQNEFYVYKRPGFDRTHNGTPGAGLGIFNWQNHLYSIKAGWLYRDNAFIGGSGPRDLMNPSGLPLDTTRGYAFAPTMGADPVLFFTNGVAAYRYYPATTLIEDLTPVISTSGTGPISTEWLADVVYLDGYVLIFGTDSKLWNSAADNPASWNAGEWLLARVDSDDPIALHKHLSYVLCIKQYYTEVFYDAGVGTTGVSPLAPVQGAKMNFGCIDGRTVADCGGDVMWVARTREGSVSVVIVSSLKAQVVSTAPVERLLQAADYSGPVYSWAAKVDGHRFYGVTVVNSNITLVYDLTSGFWQQWTDPDGNYLPYAASAIDTNNLVVFQHENDGDLYHLHIDAYGDEEEVFPVDIYTPNFDAGTRRIKTLTKMNVYGDQAEGSILEVSYSDDDYQTWVDAGSVDLSTDDPFLADLGSFRKRAFRFRHYANAPMRLRAVEVFIDAGAG